MTANQIFFLGVFAGFAVGGPYGPSGTLSFYRSIQYGWRTGLFTAMGSLLAIFLFSFLAAFFIEFAAPVIHDRQILKYIRLIMGLVLLVFGLLFVYSNFRSKSNHRDKEVNDNKGYLMSFLSAFVVGLVSGKNVIGFPTFLIATRYIIDISNPASLKAFIFSIGSLLSSSFLYFLLIVISVRWGTLLFSGVQPFMKHMVSILFVGLGIYLVIRFFL